MDNRTLAHRFFYQDTQGTRGDYANMSLSFNGDTIYSYYTAIGQIIKNKKGEKLLLCSDDNMTPTTSKHLGYVRSACPFEIVHVPMNYGSHYVDIDTIEKNILDNLERHSQNKMTLAENRRMFSNDYRILLNFSNKVKKISKKIINKYKKLYDMVNNEDQIKILKGASAEKIKKEREQIKKELADIIAKNTFSELCNIAFEYNCMNESERKLKQNLKKYLQPNKDTSIIWFNGDELKTSQGITVDKCEAITMMRLYNTNRLKHGMKISYYTVLHVDKNYLKVGCHKITKSNVMELLKEVQADKTQLCEV